MVSVPGQLLQGVGGTVSAVHPWMDGHARLTAWPQRMTPCRPHLGCRVALHPGEGTCQVVRCRSEHAARIV